MNRSSSAAVRNPIAGDPSVAAILSTLSPEARRGLRLALKALSASWRIKADQAWFKHKAPMAAYWKASAVNARHLSVAISNLEKS